MTNGVLAAHLAKIISPTSVLDVGEMGVKELNADDGHYDLAVGLDIQPHPVRAAKALAAAVAARADVVAWSPSVVPGTADQPHWPSDWAAHFRSAGLKPYDLARRELWWNQAIPWQHRQNVLVYATDEVAVAHGWEECPAAALDLAQPALLMPELDTQLDATVCIPWRPSPSRLAAFERVQSFWAQFGWPIVTADSDTEVFSLAQARNNAVRQAKTRVVVICDADTLVDPLNVLRAVAEPSGVCWPFTKYRVMDQKYLDLPYEQLADVPYINTWDGDGIQGVGGCLVATVDEFWRLGGQPPEFIGWGWEDTAFTMVVRTLSTTKRAVGCLYAFEHNEDADSYVDAKADTAGWDRDPNRNEHLIKPYMACDLVPWKMRNLIKTRRVDG